jgi:hypothetical protein
MMQTVYLGDGVYASFDGCMVSLAVGHHTNDVVHLGPEVFLALVRYATEAFNSGPTDFTLEVSKVIRDIGGDDE